MASFDCSLRLTKMLNPTPPIRYILTSPYPDYNQYQLDMRRKAEILKYNKSNTKTNNLTKKQKFSYIISKFSGGGVTASLSDQCTNNENVSIPLPSYYSGVPGSTMLFNNPSIPLYNYSYIKPSFSQLTTE